MARETKVGLLVGLCVILLIGIIVSDHLSVVQSQDPAQLNIITHTTQWGLTDQGLVQQSGAGTAEAAMHTVPAATPVTPTPVQQNQDFIPVQPPPPPALPNNPNTNHQQGVTIADGGQTHVDQPATLNNKPTSPTVAVLDTHIVKHGDTLYQLAKLYYHRGDRWQVILDANPALDSTHPKLKDGSKLIIPALSDSKPIAIATPVQDVPTGVPATRANVLVQRHDTLALLAARYLGSRDRWHEILAMNRDQLRRASDLRVGMTLRLPTGQSAATPSEDTAIVRGPMSSTNTVVPVANQTFTPISYAAQRRLTGNDVIYPDGTGQSPQGTFTRPGTPWPVFGASARNPVTPAVQRIYTVQPNDSLQDIAAKTLGDSNQAQRIYDANRTTLAMQTQLQIGQQLVIPAASSR